MGRAGGLEVGCADGVWGARCGGGGEDVYAGGGEVEDCWGLRRALGAKKYIIQ